ncbi:hypothetical protein HZU73_06761 [Apis mellifera caucasica]|nr:hypothetical protein HZU73_06761 [Apis mellifera caucasica]KAG9429766.1 hypothetical protein HZU67_09096 [Apis mellifera carnica]
MWNGTCYLENSEKWLVIFATITRIRHNRHVHSFLECSGWRKWPKHQFISGGKRGSNTNEPNNGYTNHDHGNNIIGHPWNQNPRTWTQYHQKRISTHCT